MTHTMTSELFWLTATVLMTALFWVPYILNRVVEKGLLPAMGNPAMDERPHAAWADRMMCAHRNAVENLVIFAPLVLALHVAGVSTGTTVMAATTYFWARLAHYLVYTLGIPYLRTLAFFVGFVAQIMLAMTLLA